MRCIIHNNFQTFSVVTSNLRNKHHLLFENCLKAQSKVKKLFRLIFYLHKSELHKTIEMLLRVGGQTENSIKSAAESLNRNSFNWEVEG